MKEYDHQKIEPKWQKYWERKKLNHAKDPKLPHLSASGSHRSASGKFYGLIEFPYPSGDGLHVGHIRSNTAMDIICRKRRAEGFDVLYPIGWDAFGLPTENYAIKTGIQPSVVTKKNTDIFRKQLKALGFSFDWSREINTTDPAYYKWTQWIFLKFFEKGLAYKKKMAINWCPKDKIGLANEEVVDGKCERCGTAVEKREKEQWMLAITKYADRLDKDLDLRRILIGTRNPAKVKMIKACLAGVKGIELVSLDDIPAVDDSGLKEGDDFKENARLKSEFYFNKTGIPTISTDHILWIEKWPENKGFMVHMRKHANPESPRATDEEVLVFFKNFLKTVGGSSKANFHYAISYTDEKGTHTVDEVPHHYVLQTEQSKNYWPGYPAEALLKDVDTGLFKSEQSDDIRYAKVIKTLREKFAPRMLAGHTPVDYLERIRIQQKNWIGRSDGALIRFALVTTPTDAEHTRTNAEKVGEVEVFTTRADTLFGATYLVLAPEHSVIENCKLKNLSSAKGIENWDEVVRYIVQTKKKSEIERTTDTKDKTGVELKGIRAINPANKEEIPIFVADYVLADYGTGAIMAVPAHDERDFEFAKKYNLLIKQVVVPCADDSKNPPKPGLEEVKRDTVIVHLRDKSTGKFALLDWHGTLEGITTAIMGGIEQDQTPEEAALMEISEEATIKNIKIIKKAQFITAAKYCASHKNQNRCAHTYSLLAEVENLTNQGVISEQEQKIHTLVWVKENEVLNRLTPDHQKQVWQMLHEETALTAIGYLINSGKFDGMDSEKAKKEITKFVGGKEKTTFKLRDWIFSRQRYWGEPIPLVYCENCRRRTSTEINAGWVPVPEKDLPIKLPNVKNYMPTGTGESPLASISKWVNVKCPKCGGKAKRETDTMPNWAGSSWYYLAYVAKHDSRFMIHDSRAKRSFAKWLPVDWYNGGMEHTTLHLLYSRFWHKFLFDLGLVPTSEPYAKRTSHGIILAEGGAKMSKSKGNVVSPDDLIKTFGADTLRLYEMFMGPFDQHIAWSTESMVGPRRFLEKIWRLFEKTELSIINPLSRGQVFQLSNNEQTPNRKLETLIHKTIKKVGDDIEAMRFNTAVSSMMVLVNEMEKEAEISVKNYKILLQLLAPFAPHITEELWNQLGEKTSIHLEPWPSYDSTLASEAGGVLIVQVNGKVRANVNIDGQLSESEAKEMALALPEIQKWIVGATIKKVIYVKGRLLNIVI